MSAWIVTAAHIDVLVLAGVQFHVLYDLDRAAAPGPVMLAAVGADLWAENHRSVGYRYGDPADPPAYPAPTAEVILDAVAVVSAVDCFTYQSSEHPAWAASRAADYCTRLRAAAMTGLPVEDGDPRYPQGWQEAPWGVVDLAQVAARPAASAGGR